MLPLSAIIMLIFGATIIYGGLAYFLIRIMVKKKK
jgi:hypothetical protein